MSIPGSNDVRMVPEKKRFFFGYLILMKRVYYRYFTYIWQEQKDLLSFVSMEVASLGEPFSFKDRILVTLEFDELCLLLR